MSYFPVPDDAFKDSLPKTVGEYLVILFNWLWVQVARVTTGTLRLYVDGTDGDDSNSGLSPTAPKKTLQAVVDLIPDIVRHPVVVHMSGVFDEQGKVVFVRQLISTTVLFDGGDEMSVVDDNGGSHYTTTAGTSASAIEVSGAGWTTDEHEGYLIKILSGPAAGEVAMVQGNDSDTVTPQKDLGANPGEGATFDIVRPATTWQASVANADLEFSGQCDTSSTVRIQRISVSGSQVRINVGGFCKFLPGGGIVMDSTRNRPINCSGARQCGTGSVALNRDVVFPLSVMSGYSGGVSFLGSVPTAIWMANTPYAGVGGSVVKSGLVDLRNCGMSSSAIANGARLDGGLFMSSGCQTNADNTMVNSAGWATTKISNSGGVGITLGRNSFLGISGGTIADCSSHGIEVFGNSLLWVKGAAAGTGNAGAGVYAHSGAVVHITSGTPPTITGTVGNFTFDGTTEAGTWAGVDAGVPVAHAAEASSVKEADVSASAFVYQNANAATTPLGGRAVRMLNKTGAASVKGTVLTPSSSDDGAVALAGTDELDPTAIMYSDGVADGSYVWVVKNGLVEVKLENSVGTTRGYWGRTSSTAAGRVDATTASTPGLILEHFQEVCHMQQSVSGDAGGALALATVHFN
jgi:hypothetical protein